MRYHPPSTRPANVLLLFVLFLFIIMTMAALVLDMGQAILARRQMQTAAKTGALEGLRFGDPEKVKTMVNWVFDDDLDESNDLNPPPLQVYPPLGPGPNLKFTGGIPLPGTDFIAAQKVSANTERMRVDLQKNENNYLWGDMVKGSFALTYLTADLKPGESQIKIASKEGFKRPFEDLQNPSQVTNEFFIRVDQELMLVKEDFFTTTWIVQRENSDLHHYAGAFVTLADPYREGSKNPEKNKDLNIKYARNDFHNEGSDAFLVRLRRTKNNEPEGISNLQPVPFILGRGSLFLPPDLKADGISVRATAISKAFPTVSTGPPQLLSGEFPGLKGSTSFALTLNAWKAISPDGLKVDLKENGSIEIGGNKEGLFFMLPFDNESKDSPIIQIRTKALLFSPKPVYVGERLIPEDGEMEVTYNLKLPLSNSEVDKNRFDLYVPILDNLINGQVLAFGYAHMIAQVDASSLKIIINKKGDFIAVENVSASPILALQLKAFNSISDKEKNPVSDSGIIKLINKIPSYDIQPLQSPMLVR
jgi:hypothetical protein